MRLTLRTLLAYLDEILDPQDAAQLKNKIDESEFAAALVHRIRGSVRRLRLDAPALDAQGVGGDVNSVAEYLDNTLPAAQVPSFEKVCLESDVHLGEVASCHQVLTLVLGEPAAVSDKTRQRVYQIAPSGAAFAEGSPRAAEPPSAGASRKPQASRLSQVPGAPHIPAAGAPDAVPTSTKEAWRAEERQVRSQQDRGELADAQRTSRKPSIVRSLAITAVIAFLITAALILAMGPLDQSHPLARWVQGYGDRFASSETEPEELDSQSIAEATDLRESSPRVASPTQMTNEPSPTGGISPSRANDSIPPLAPPANHDAAADASILPPPQLNPPANNDLSQSPDFQHADAPTARDAAPSRPEPVALDEPSRLEQPAAAVPQDDMDAFDQVSPDTVNVQPIFPPQVDTISPPDMGDPVEVTTEPPVANSAGVVDNVIDDPRGFDNDDRIILDDNNGVAADFAPKIGTDSLDLEGTAIADSAPAELNPRNAVGNDADIEAVEPAASPEPGRLISKREVLLRLDETSGSWRRADAEALLNAGDQLLSLPTFRPQVLLPSAHCTLIDGTKLRLGQQQLLALEYGQVLLSPTPNTRRVDINLAGQPVKLEFADDSSAAAVRVRRRHVPGSDPERDAAHAIVEIHAAIGSVQVDAGGQQFRLDPTRKVILLDQHSPRVVDVANLPKWIEGKDIPGVDRDASKRLQPFLVADRPVTLSLQERSEDRRYDVRALAVRSLGQLDHFDALVAALNDPSQRSYWTSHVDALHEALARSAETAARVRVALEKVHGPEAQRLFEMLWGYSSEQLAAGSAESLVENLIHNSLDYRVLAFENLQRITDATLTYRPWLAAPRRRQGVARWRERLRKGLITYKEPPEIVTLLNEFAEAGGA